MPDWFIEGHAIVSADGRIADANGHFPDALRDDADWTRFQAALDRAAAVVLGRASHDAAPDAAGRLRVVLSGGAPGLARAPDGAWRWNPQDVAVEAMLAEVAPEGGVIGVAGGRRVYDLFLGHGFDAFDLVTNAAARLPGGTPVFTGVTSGAGDAAEAGRTPERVLALAGLVPGPAQALSPGVSLRTWRKPAARRRTLSARF